MHRKEHPLRPAAVIKAARQHGRQPGGLQLAGSKPDGVVEGIIPFRIDRMQDQFGGPLAADGCQRPHRLEPDEHGGVVNAGRQQLQRIVEAVGPVSCHTGGGSTAASIGRGEHLLEQRSVDVVLTATVDRLGEPEALTVSADRHQGC